jgi:hypothetical protein
MHASSHCLKPAAAGLSYHHSVLGCYAGRMTKGHQVFSGEPTMPSAPMVTMIMVCCTLELHTNVHHCHLVISCILLKADHQLFNCVIRYIKPCCHTLHPTTHAFILSHHSQHCSPARTPSMNLKPCFGIRSRRYDGIEQFVLLSLSRCDRRSHLNK